MEIEIPKFKLDWMKLFGKFFMGLATYIPFYLVIEWMNNFLFLMNSMARGNVSISLVPIAFITTVFVLVLFLGCLFTSIEKEK